MRLKQSGISMKSLFSLFAICFGLLSTHSLASNTVNNQPINISGSEIRYIIDRSHALTVDDIILLRKRDWTENSVGTPTFGFAPHTYWFRIELPASDRDRLIQLDYALLDEVEMFRVEDGRLEETIRTGDKDSFSNRPIYHRSFLFPVDDTTKPQVIIFRVKTTSAVQLPLYVWDAASFFQVDQNVLLAHGLYYGIVLVMVLYNFFLFLRLKDSAYIFYVLFVLTFAAAQMSLTGFAYQFLWPEFPHWNEISLAVITPLIVVVSIVFAVNFLKLQKFNIRSINILYLQVIAGLLIAALSTFLPYQLMIKFGAALSIISCLHLFCLSYYVAVRYTHKYAIIFSAAWTLFLLGTVILALNKFGFIPRTWLTESSAQIGSAIEIILLSFALAERLHDANNRRFRAEQELIQTQREQNERLEHEVELRTKELSHALGQVRDLNEELTDISTTDQLTGIRNRRYFDELIDRELRRAIRNETPLTLVLIDLDRFKHVNDTYGHLAGDICLRLVSNELADMIRRPPDLVCRYGGEELAVLLPDTDLEGALTLSERMRAKVESLQIVTPEHVFNVTASFGICAMVPNKDTDISTYIDKADQALYRAKEEGRNRVCESSS